MILAGAGVAALIAVAALVWRAGGDEQTPLQEFANEDPGPIHVHGLGVNPADRALFIATHTGLYRVAQDERQATRVGDRYQDTMGFTIIGPNRFLGSGHPDLNEARTKGLPPHLGLIESNDSGESWQPISLQGEADFHVLRFAGQRVYGYDASNDRLLTSSDRGRSWNELAKPGPLVDLAVSPGGRNRMVAASAGGLQEGLFESRDGGESWRRVTKAIGLLAWPKADRLYILVTGGQVFRSRDGGRSLEHRGEIGGQPAAFLAVGPDELYAALHDGTIKRSSDGGVTWSVRSAPSPR
jgi:photosystem II stability/assembly factor-like uncharacterized protein